ncbi:MAG: RNA methyltransferase, partial [Chitinophagaceae bacterium]
GGANVVVTNSSPEQFAKLPKLFDLIVVDAPCSGSGLFRKDPEAIDEWSLQNVQMCARRQKDILEHAIPSLADGGILIYSTCSYSEEEDEDIAAWCVEQGFTGTRLSIDPSWNIIEVEAAPGAYGYRFYPDKLDGEGFFLAAFKKSGERREIASNNLKRKAGINAADLKVLESWVNTGSMVAELWQNEILLMPPRVQAILPVLQKSLYLKSAGLRTGAIVRGEPIPDHALATSGLVKENVERFEVDLDNALRYLRREEILNASLPAGWFLVTYNKVPLGWIKSLGNRFNNYYPKEWRIRMKG